VVRNLVSHLEGVSGQDSEENILALKKRKEQKLELLW
jgi:hypothetical protein